jgi:hypothetical protein
MQDVLLDGLDHLVCLAHVHCLVPRQHPLASDPELQGETMGAVRFLVRSGLAEVGYRGPGGRFVAEPLDVAMQEVHDAYVRHYDQPDDWIWCCWLHLTPAGRRFARSRQRATGTAATTLKRLVPRGAPGTLESFFLLC